MQVADFGALARGADFLSYSLLEGERRNVGGREGELVEIVLRDLCHRRDRQHWPLARADLELDFHTLRIVVVEADRVGGAALVRQIPVLVLIEPEREAVVGLRERIQHHHHQVVEVMSVRHVKSRSVDRRPRGPKTILRSIVPPLKATCSVIPCP